MFQFMGEVDDGLRKVLKNTNMSNVSIWELRQLLKAHEAVERNVLKMDRIINNMNNN